MKATENYIHALINIVFIIFEVVVFRRNFSSDML